VPSWIFTAIGVCALVLLVAVVLRFVVLPIVRAVLGPYAERRRRRQIDERRRQMKHWRPR
jgi:hypothetical protein